MTAGALTLKHVDKSGNVSITQALAVSGNKSIEKGATFEIIAHGVPMPNDNGFSRYSTGIVYVMNDAGRTVGTYYLDQE